MIAGIHLHLNAQCSGNAIWLNDPNDGLMEDTGLIAGSVLVYASTNGTMSSGRPLYRTTSSTWKGLNYAGLQVWRAYSSIASNYTSFALSSPLDSNVFHVRVDNIRGDFPNMETQSVRGFYQGTAVASTFKDPVNGATRSGNSIVGGSTTNSTTQSAMRVFFHSPVDSIVVQQTSLSDWIIAELMVECLYVLPSALHAWNAEKAGGQVNLSWIYKDGPPIRCFEVERSTDGIAFSTIAKQNSSNSIQYATQDTDPANGKNYYRLKMVYENGHIAYSDIVVISWQHLSLLRVYPNPASAVIMISLGVRQYTLGIYSIDGRAKEMRMNARGLQTINISNWPKGCYLVRAAWSGGAVTKTVWIR